ncbi:MAG: hypothetical protein WBN28_11095 [Lutimonas sp.]
MNNVTGSTDFYVQKRLLIVSVYAPSELNEHWYKLQKHFIKKNTLLPYDFKIITNNVKADIFNAEDIIKENNENIGHPAGIRQMLEFMRVNEQYSGYLILDSDCFPVRPGWHVILDQQMQRFDKTLAAPVRYENLDMFPHPCVVYMSKDGVKNPKINFDYKEVKNLLGDMINEVGGAMCEMSDEVLPLLRSNRVNLHPVAAGIYHHLFYHHAAGSRGFEFRLLKMYEYCSHWIDDESQSDYGEQLFEALIGDPDGFIDKLMHGY